MSQHPEQAPLTVGVVSFLNSRPLIEGLDADPAVKLIFAVPADLAAMLRSGQVNAALIPVVDLARAGGAWQRISDGCIGSDGKTLTVRVFSKVPPDEMDVLHVDKDSHTSVALARLIWAHVYGRELRLEPIPEVDKLPGCTSVLLIGDKVVTTPMRGFGHQIDLGEAWKNWTGLPFVFAVWAGPRDCEDQGLAQRLSEARDRGVARAAQIAAEKGPGQGWLIEFAEDYLVRRLMYKLTPAAEQGMNRFFELLAEAGIVPQARELVR